MLKEIAQRLVRGEALTLVSCLDGANCGKSAYIAAGERVDPTGLIGCFSLSDASLPYCTEAPNALFVEQALPKPTLVLCGAGHVAKATAYFASAIGFSMTVIDERQELCTPERFPNARLLPVTFCEGLKSITAAAPYYVLLASDPEQELYCLNEVLLRRHSYIGLLGSRRKIRSIFETLAEQGVSKKALAEVHAPVGIKVGARTPSELGLCITAELIETKNRSGDESIWDVELVNALCVLSAPAMLLTLTRVVGTAPRRAGARMLLLSNGISIASIGGGHAEHLALIEARQLLLDKRSALLRFPIRSGSEDFVEVLFQYCEE